MTINGKVTKVLAQEQQHLTGSTSWVEVTVAAPGCPGILELVLKLHPDQAKFYPVGRRVRVNLEPR